MNPFYFGIGQTDIDLNISTKFLAVVWNLDLGFKDVDDLGAVEVVMQLEDVLDGTKDFKRSL